MLAGGRTSVTAAAPEAPQPDVHAPPMDTGPAITEQRTSAKQQAEQQQQSSQEASC